MARGGGAGGREALVQQEATQQPAIEEVQEGHDERRRGLKVLPPMSKRHNNQIKRWRSSHGYHCHDNDCGDNDDNDHDGINGRGFGCCGGQ